MGVDLKTQPDAVIHVPALDGLRGAAILLVLFFHFSIVIPDSLGTRVFQLIARSGWAGVDLFFVLSGFLITGILLDAKGGPHFFRNYLARRTLRIFPLYFAAIFVLLVLWPFFHISRKPEHAIWIVTYTSNIFAAIHNGFDLLPQSTGHFWSLAVEEQFYLLWPLLVFLLSRRALRFTLAGMIVAATLVRIVLLYENAGVAAYVLTPARMDLLAVGGWLALEMRELGLPRCADLSRGLLLAGAVLLVGVAWNAHDDAALPSLSRVVQLAGYPAIAMVSAGLVIHVLSKPASALTALFGEGLLPFLGRYSYGMYVIHQPLRWLLQNRLLRGVYPRVSGFWLDLAQALALCIITLGLAMLSYHLYEKRFLALKRYFAVGWAPIAGVRIGLAPEMPIAMPERPASSRPSEPGKSRR